MVATGGMGGPRAVGTAETAGTAGTSVAVEMVATWTSAEAGSTSVAATAAALTSAAATSGSDPTTESKSDPGVTFRHRCRSQVWKRCSRRAASATEPLIDGYTVNAFASWSAVRFCDTAIATG